MAVTNVQPEYFQEPERKTPRPGADMRRTKGARVNVEARRGRRTGPVTPTDANPFHETQDETFSKKYDATERYTNPKNNQINRVERTYAPENDNRPLYQPSAVPQVSKRVNHKNKAAAKAKKTAARLAATRINAWVIGWSITWYLSFQWWMGLISVVGLGMAYAVYSSIIALPGGEFITGTIEREGNVFNNTTTSFFDAILAWAASLFGISFNPMLLFLIPSALLLLLGLLQLLIVCFMYSGAGVKPLWGEHWGLKLFTFVIALVSSVTPLPLIFLWLGVVWKNPK